VIPSPWEFLLLALGAYRLTRLGGWDEFPLAARIRAWAIGERWVPEPAPTWAGYIERQGIHLEIPEGLEKAEGTGRVDPAELGLPGKQPSSEVANVRPAYDRPVLAHLVHCPFCLGWWVSLAAWLAWLQWPSGTLLALSPFALSAAVGLIAKNLDP
jgi:hypothetical protein